jgi:antitoxin VapB
VISINDSYQVEAPAQVNTAKLFWTGRSQAVRLPKEFRFEGEEVRIRRQGNAVILEPVADDWKWLDDLVERADGKFLEEGIEEPPPQERPALDDFMK